jgi:hypothetical protein
VVCPRVGGPFLPNNIPPYSPPPLSLSLCSLFRPSPPSPLHPSYAVEELAALIIQGARKIKQCRFGMRFLQLCVRTLETAMEKRRLDVLLDGLEAAAGMSFQPRIVEVARRFAKQLVRGWAGRAVLEGGGEGRGPCSRD